MKFRIDIQDEKVDLSKFQRACKVYMGQMERVEFEIFLKEYTIRIDITQVEGHSQRLVKVEMWDVKRTDDGLIKAQTSIMPLNDGRFQEIKIIKELFVDQYARQATFEASDAAQAAAKLEMFIRTIFKVNNLKVFL